MSTFQRLRQHRLLWPAITLLLLLAVNATFNPGFWQLQWRDGHLYGSVIDILNRAAPLALVALGMTLVIATRGIDISVGAVVAIAAAVAALMIGGELVVKDGVRWRWPRCAGCGTGCWWHRWACSPSLPRWC
jgi:galactofuranose transport system permease protein